MSEPDLASSRQQPSVRDATVPISSGTMLRQAREALGLHIGALAVSLKVPVKKLEALEADRFDLLPDTVFVRALASSICRSLKIDPNPILEKLPRSTAPHLKAYESGAKVPFRSSGGYSTGWFRDQLTKPLAWVVVALLVGAMALVLLPYARQTGELSATKTPTVEVDTAPALPVPATPAASETALSQALVPAAGAAGPADLVAGSGAVTGTVVFKAQALSWVEVVDGSGVVQVRRNLAAGEVVGASGVPPLTVVVGRADTTAVEVHGKPFDVLSIAKDNVAHFEVK